MHAAPTIRLPRSHNSATSVIPSEARNLSSTYIALPQAPHRHQATYTNADSIAKHRALFQVEEEVAPLN